MTNVWFVVEIEDAVRSTVLSGQKLQVVVSPRFTVTEDLRKLEDIVRSGVDKGFECIYCTRYSGIAPWQLKNVDKVVKVFIEKKLGSKVSEWSVSINPTARLLEPRTKTRERI